MIGCQSRWMVPGWIIPAAVRTVEATHAVNQPRVTWRKKNTLVSTTHIWFGMHYDPENLRVVSTIAGSAFYRVWCTQHLRIRFLGCEERQRGDCR